MAPEQKDSPAVIEFMAIFAKVKDWCDDDPGELLRLSEDDDGVKSLSDTLFWSGIHLERNERRRRELFAAPVDPNFLAQWRDFEERFRDIVGRIFLSEIYEAFGDSTASSVVSKADLQWDNADDEAKEQAGGIDGAIDFARFNADQELRWIDQPNFIERIEDGIGAWERLKQETGFDLHGVFRRRALVPFVLVPRKVAAKYGNTQQFSMLHNLQQAHDAFVFGATYASLALMRSIMESVLRDHYHAKGNDLNDRIRNVRDRLPPGANEAALHRLRKVANAILHLDHERDEGLANMDPVRLEKEIISLLFVLRALIEGAKIEGNATDCPSLSCCSRYCRNISMSPLI
ncbi:DUF4145 domain-containing protein [Mesorhizobium sp. M0025]|uniref:DUF4145 domain-containing protein n=1 Tax=Mesorhizobium sp. M0025 TaxID=2956846 RepID=UPI00333966CF